MHRLLSLAALLTSGLPLAAQTTIEVGPNGYPNINAALAAAAPGDEILVEPGAYAEFITTISCTIRARVPGTVTVGPGLLSSTILLSDPGDRVRLVGLAIARLLCIAGGVSIEDCFIAGSAPALTLGLCIAHMERCSLNATPFILPTATVSITESTVSMVECTVRGATDASAIMLDDESVMTAGGCFLESGATASTPRAAVIALGGSTVRIRDSALLSAAGVCPILAPDAVCDRCVLSEPCPGLTVAPLLGAELAGGALAPGQTFSVAFRGEPNDFLLVFGSNALDAVVAPELDVPFLLDAAGCVAAGAGMTDAVGELTMTWQLPSAPLPAGIGVWLQGVSGSSLPLRASPVVGGVYRQ